MPILVTGSQGHIGKRFVSAAREAGYTVRTFDRTALPKEAGNEHFVGDLCDIRDMRRAIEGMDAVVHLGAIANDRGSGGEEVLQVNVSGTWNILLACGEVGVKRVVYFSSINALGAVGGHRKPEYLPLDDDYPRHPLSPYQLSKHLAEEACKSFGEKYGITTICLRPTFVTAENMQNWWQGASIEMREKYEKDELFAYIDVRDVCDAALRSLTVEGVTHDAFLLSAADTTIPIPTAELVQRYYNDIPWTKTSPETYLEGQPFRSLVDCTHAEKVLGWKARYSWRTGTDANAP